VSIKPGQLQYYAMMTVCEQQLSADAPIVDFTTRNNMLFLTVRASEHKNLIAYSGSKLRETVRRIFGDSLQ
jgi:hypothetical protein